MHGGKRPGAGRPKGSVSPKTLDNRAIAIKAASEGVTPLEVMLSTMREAWGHANDKTMDPVVALEHRKMAVAVAKDAAPYIHPRLSQIESKTELDVKPSTVSADPLPPEEWERTYGVSH